MLTRLTDDTRVVIRTIRAEDKHLLAAGILQLSPESSRRRFLVAKGSLTTRELRYLTEVDGEFHVALVAVLADQPQTLVADGRYVRFADDPTIAEVAVVVGDCLQGQGLGTRLGLLLADHARAHGVQRFSASLLSDNVPAHRLFAKISERLETTREGPVDQLTAHLLAA
jgi:RimJ/RimL family protein N-acetyltransferase